MNNNSVKKKKNFISRKLMNVNYHVFRLPLVISVEMILLLLLKWQRQYSFTSRRYSSSVHYFRTGSESPMKEKRIYLNAHITSQKGKAAFTKRILLSMSKTSGHIFFFSTHLMLLRSTFDKDFDENTIPRFSFAK